jgi:hypothetical protein
MIVRTLGNSRDVSGLYIGARNVRRHFPRDRQHIELTLGHLHIFCDLPPEFWEGCPEIHDHRLAAWLQSRVFHGKTTQGPAPIAMVPKGNGAFRLVPYSIPAASSNGLSKIGPPPAVVHAEKEIARGKADRRTAARMHPIH